MTPMDERARQREFEERFLAELRARATGLLRGRLPADRAIWEEGAVRADAVRTELSRVGGGLDRRKLFDEMPGTRDVLIRFQRSMLGGLLRPTVARLRAAVVVNVEELAHDRPGAPASREQVLDALARYELLPSADRPSAVVLASPTGFSSAARALVNRAGGPKLVLMGGRADGGWDVDAPDALKKSPWVRLFDFETQDEQLRRLLYHLEQESAVLDTRGVSIRQLAEKMGLPDGRIEALVRQACRVQPQLLTLEHEGAVCVYRTPLPEEGRSMSLWNRVRRLLRLPPTPAERVRELTAQRIRIEQQRHDVDARLNTLETEERTLLERGVAAASDAEKRQVAGRLARLRLELGRVRAQANVYTQQITVIGTQIHHMTLKEQVRRTPLPRPEELTREAAETEAVINELAVSADLAGNIEVASQTPRMAEREEDILAEFEQIRQDRAASSAAAAGSAGASGAAGQRAAGAGERAGSGERAAGAAGRVDGSPAGGSDAQRSPPGAEGDAQRHAPRRADPARPEAG
ncbi:MAG: hypothetical protein IPM64_01880 [Phycisphaerales bacterium]|nr:hypothetical protein [Phycisphaerales bacterium]